MFMAGFTTFHIRRKVGLTARRIEQIIERELRESAQRRLMLTDEALSVHIERTERLFLAHWSPALKGNHRSAEICRRILEGNARLFGLADSFSTNLPAPTGDLPDSPEPEPDDEPEDELAALRAARGA